MASRKRRPTETQEDYRINLKNEDKYYKHKLTHGKILQSSVRHPSGNYVTPPVETFEKKRK